MLSREGPELQEFLHVTEAERELPIAELDDLLGDARTEDAPTIHRLWFPAVFTVFVSVVHLGIGRRQFLEHQVLRLNGLIQEVENSSMKSEIQLDRCFALVLMGRCILEIHPSPFHHPASGHRLDGPDGVPNPSSALLQIVCDSVCPRTVYNVRIVQMDQEVNPELYSVMQLLPVGRSATSGSRVDAPLSR